MPEPAPQIDPVFRESEDLRIRLLFFAREIFAGAGVPGVNTILPGTSTTADDLVANTIVKVLLSGKWKPGSGGPDIFPYAKVALDHAFIDLLRNSAHKTSASIDVEEAERLGKINHSGTSVSPFKAIASQQTYEWVLRKLGSDEMAKACVIAIQNGATTRAEIAEDLGVEPEEVTKIQRRLQYKLHKMEQLMWEFKDQL